MPKTVRSTAPRIVVRVFMGTLRLVSPVPRADRPALCWYGGGITGTQFKSRARMVEVTRKGHTLGAHRSAPRRHPARAQRRRGCREIDRHHHLPVRPETAGEGH